MLKVDPTLDHIPAKRGHVMSLFESINQPVVNIPNQGTAPTGAFILGTRNDRGEFAVFVYLFQPETRAVLVYRSDPRALDAEQFPREEAEAVRFVESMGFMIDDVGFKGLDPAEQESVMARTPLFRPLGRGDARFGAVGGVVAGRTQGPSSGSWPAEGSVSNRPGSIPWNAPLQPEPSRRTGSVPGSDALESFSSNTGSIVSGGTGSLAGTGSIVTGTGNIVPASGSIVPMGTGSVGSSPPALGRGLSLPGSDPGATPERRRPTADALAKVGRLLGTFGFVGLMLSMPTGCATTDPGPSRSQEAQLDLGGRALADGRWADALRHFQTVLEEREEDQHAQRGAGLAYWQLDRLDQAEAHLRRAVEADPKWSEPKNDLAVILIDQGSCEEAQRLLEAVLDDVFYPTKHFAEHNLARAEACAGDVDAAVGRLAALTEQRPKFCLAYLTGSEIALNSGRFEAAVEACEGFDESCARDPELKEKIPDSLRATCDLRKGQAYTALGDVESARTALRRCTQAADTRSACRDALALLPP